MMSLWDALRMNMMISYQELVRTFLNVFANGYAFVSGFLHIDFDPWRYDSVYWGSLIFAMLYLFAIPRNRY